MKKFITLIALFITLGFSAQTEEDPAIISTSIQKISETEYDLIFHIKILEEWHLYSQYNPDFASLPLAISIPKNTNGFALFSFAY